MNSTKPYLLLSLCLVCIVSIVAAAIIDDSSLSAKQEGEGIRVRWSSRNESGVASYAIRRAEGASGVAEKIGSIAAKGDGTNYDYLDQSVFKTSGRYFRYSIVACGPQGAELSATPFIGTSMVSSTARSTWGSIKAMFR